MAFLGFTLLLLLFILRSTYCRKPAPFGANRRRHSNPAPRGTAQRTPRSVPDGSIMYIEDTHLPNASSSRRHSTIEPYALDPHPRAQQGQDLSVSCMTLASVGTVQITTDLLIKERRQMTTETTVEQVPAAGWQVRSWTSS